MSFRSISVWEEELRTLEGLKKTMKLASYTRVIKELIRVYFLWDKVKDITTDNMQKMIIFDGRLSNMEFQISEIRKRLDDMTK